MNDPEMECLVVSDNFDNNNTCDLFTKHKNSCYEVSPESDANNDDHAELLDDNYIGNNSNKNRVSPDDSGCATSLEILSCKTPDIMSHVRDVPDDDEEDADSVIHHHIQCHKS